MHGQEVKQGGLHNALENGTGRWLKLTVRVRPSFGEEEDEGERMDAGTW